MIELVLDLTMLWWFLIFRGQCDPENLEKRKPYLSPITKWVAGKKNKDYESALNWLLM